jgi:hypothetical protein
LNKKDSGTPAKSKQSRSDLSMKRLYDSGNNFGLLQKKAKTGGDIPTCVM